MPANLQQREDQRIEFMAKRQAGEISVGDALRFRTAFAMFPRKMAAYVESTVLPAATTRG